MTRLLSQVANASRKIQKQILAEFGFGRLICRGIELGCQRSQHNIPEDGEEDYAVLSDCAPARIPSAVNISSNFPNHILPRIPKFQTLSLGNLELA